MSGCCDTAGGLPELEESTQGGGGLSTNKWFPCKKVSHNVFLQQTQLILWSLHCLQQSRGDGHMQLHGNILRRRLIAAANQLKKVTDAMVAAGRIHLSSSICVLCLANTIYCFAYVAECITDHLICGLT